jgi:hypothetical protein
MVYGWKEVFFLAAALGSGGVLNRGRGRGKKQCMHKHLPDLRLRVVQHLALQTLLPY